MVYLYHSKRSMFWSPGPWITSLANDKKIQVRSINPPWNYFLIKKYSLVWTGCVCFFFLFGTGAEFGGGPYSLTTDQRRPVNCVGAP